MVTLLHFLFNPHFISLHFIAFCIQPCIFAGIPTFGGFGLSAVSPMVWWGHACPSRICACETIWSAALAWCGALVWVDLGIFLFTQDVFGGGWGYVREEWSGVSRLFLLSCFYM